jgi:hypothetical protein
MKEKSLTGAVVRVKMRELKALSDKHGWNNYNMYKQFQLTKGKKHDLILTLGEKGNSSVFSPASHRGEGVYYQVDLGRKLGVVYDSWYIPTSVFVVKKERK